MAEKEDLLLTDRTCSAHPGKNLPGLHLMLHKCKVPSIWRDVIFTRYLYSSSYSALSEQLFY